MRVGYGLRSLGLLPRLGNFDGRIAPAYTCRFMLLGSVALYALYPAITRFIRKKSTIAWNLAISLFIAFAGDYALQIAGVWDDVKDALSIFGVKHW